MRGEPLPHLRDPTRRDVLRLGGAFGLSLLGASTGRALASGGRSARRAVLERSRLPGAGSQAMITYTPSGASSPQTGLLVRPYSPVNRTAIVAVHGGGGVTGSHVEIQPWVSLYASQGYVTFAPDYRLAQVGTDHGIYPLPEQQIKAAVQFIRRHAAELAVDRIVVHGFSAGARLGGIVLTTPDDHRFDGSDRWSDTSDHIDGFIGMYGYYDGTQFHSDAYYGTPGAPWPDSSNSVAGAARATGPTLLLHGDADWLVPLWQSERFARALESAGQQVELQVFHGATHGFDGYGATELTELGRQAALTVGAWLETEFASPTTAATGRRSTVRVF